MSLDIWFFSRCFSGWYHTILCRELYGFPHYVSQVVGGVGEVEECYMFGRFDLEGLSEPCVNEDPLCYKKSNMHP